MHNNIVYLAVENRNNTISASSDIIETLGKFNHVSEAIASFNARFNTFEHALVAYQTNDERTAVTRFFHVDSDKLVTPTLH